MNAAKEATKKKTRVILADDFKLTLDAFGEAFRASDDFQVVGEAYSGDETQQLLIQRQADLAILDFNMPGLHGEALINYARLIQPDMKILIVSAIDDFDYFKALKAKDNGKGVGRGIDGYVYKSASGNEIVNAARAVMLGKTVAIEPLSKNGKKDDFDMMQAIKGLEKLAPRYLNVLWLIVNGYSEKESEELLVIEHKVWNNYASDLCKALNTNLNQILLYRSKWQLLFTGKTIPIQRQIERGNRQVEISTK